jgi:DNA-binding GntR family transcriptional regulator
MKSAKKNKAGKKPLGKVALQIANHIRDNALGGGGHVTEFGLAEALNISRSPVRAALEQLVDLKIVSKAAPRRGFEVIVPVAVIDALTDDQVSTDAENALYLQIAEDYMTRQLDEQFSVSDITRRYKVGRGLVLRVLQKLAGDRVVERNTGYGWHFAPMLRSLESHDDSYRFRLLIEPPGILEPSFKLDAAWAARCRRAHEAIMATPPKQVSMVRLFEANASFHEMLAASSGNAFIHHAIRLQNQARRFMNYRWTYGTDQIVAGCEEHLEILSALEKGDRSWASALLRRHLERASRIKP